MFHLKQAGVDCGYLSGNMSLEESQDMMHALKQRPPTIRIVFVTPEKVARSDALMRLFDNLQAQASLVCPNTTSTVSPLHADDQTHNRPANQFGIHSKDQLIAWLLFTHSMMVLA